MLDILLPIQRFLASGSPFRPTHIVPLGLSCRVTYQVRVYFGSTTAYPFDWWVTPIDGLTRYLSDPNPDRVYGAGALDELVVNGQAITLVAPEFGFQLFHEFPRQDIGLPTRVVAPNWRAHVAEARTRHAQRLDRLLALDRRGHRILFVRDRLDVDGGSGTQTAAESVAKLWRALSNRWSRAEIELLLINVPFDTRLPQRRVRRVNFKDVPGDPPEAWRGDSTRWAQAIASAGYPPQAEVAGTAPPMAPPD